MADSLRYTGFSASDPVPDQPNMNVVPPAAPSGSADAATTAGATYRDDFIRSEPDEFLDPEYGYADGRSLAHDHDDDDDDDDLIATARNSFTKGFDSLREHLSYITEGLRDGTFQQDLQERGAAWMDHASNLAADLRGSASSLASNARFRAAEMKDHLLDRSQDVRQSTRQFINQRPARAIAVAAGAGLVLGVLLRLGRGRSRREY